MHRERFAFVLLLTSCMHDRIIRNANGTVPKDNVAIVDGAADAQKKKRKKRSKKKKAVVQNDDDDDSDDEENEEVAAPVVKASVMARQTSLGVISAFILIDSSSAVQTYYIPAVEAFRCCPHQRPV